MFDPTVRRTFHRPAHNWCWEGTDGNHLSEELACMEEEVTVGGGRGRVERTFHSIFSPFPIFWISNSQMWESAVLNGVNSIRGLPPFPVPSFSRHCPESCRIRPALSRSAPDNFPRLAFPFAQCLPSPTKIGPNRPFHICIRRLAEVGEPQLDGAAKSERPEKWWK